MNEIEIDLSKYIDNFKIDKDKAKQYGGYKKIANDLSKENIKLAFKNTILQSKIDKANEILDKLEMQPAYLDCKYYELDGFNELRNTLKEDK